MLYTEIAMQIFCLSRTLHVETLQVCKSRMEPVQKEKQTPPPSAHSLHMQI
jgi:hypothetical protein